MYGLWLKNYATNLFAEITIAPQTQYLLQNVDQTATFFCQAVGINSFWIIDSHTVPADGNNNLTNKGWMFTEVVHEDTAFERDNIHNMTLQIPSRIEFNNTQVQCLATKQNADLSDPVFLIIKGTCSCHWLCFCTWSVTLYYIATMDILCKC